MIVTQARIKPSCDGWKANAMTRDDTDNKKCIRMLCRARKPCQYAAPHCIQTQQSSRYAAPQVMYCSNFHKHQKKISSVAYDIQKT